MVDLQLAPAFPLTGTLLWRGSLDPAQHARHRAVRTVTAPLSAGLVALCALITLWSPQLMLPVAVLGVGALVAVWGTVLRTRTSATSRRFEVRTDGMHFPGALEIRWEEVAAIVYHHPTHRARLRADPLLPDPLSMVEVRLHNPAAIARRADRQRSAQRTAVTINRHGEGSVFIPADGFPAETFRELLRVLDTRRGA